MITKDMTMAEIVRLYPQTLEIFNKYGMDCLECQLAELEKLEYSAGMHKLDMDKLLEELNRATGE
jgi:hybrid cluster-associated redox disulfide protein